MHQGMHTKINDRLMPSIGTQLSIDIPILSPLKPMSLGALCYSLNCSLCEHVMLLYDASDYQHWSM